MKSPSLKLFLLLLCWILAAAAAPAQKTTRCTNWTKMDGSGNLGTKSPKPKFTLPDVQVKCCLTVDKKTGDVEQSCRFFNGGATFDATSCATCFSANRATNYNTPPTHPPKAVATGFWIMSDVPITDPFVRWQEVGGTLHPVEYNPFHADLAVPSNFPVNCPLLGRTSPGTQPLSSYDLDLLLRDLYTMSDPPSAITNVDIVPYGSPSA